MKSNEINQSQVTNLKSMEIEHSKKHMISYGFGRFVDSFLVTSFSAFVFYYYESEIGLAIWLLSVAYIIFAIWNAINDPFIGYITDRPYRFTKKLGRRFPWLIVGGIPWGFCYLLLFTPPIANPQNGALLIFGWLLITIILFETSASVYSVNMYAIFPDKFRADKERRTASGIALIVSSAGNALGAIIPPLFIEFGNLQSYIFQAVVVIIITLIALVLSIPGCRDDQIRVDDFILRYKESKERESFVKSFRLGLKHKNFRVYIFAFIFYSALVLTAIASIPYYVRFVLKMKAFAITLIMAGYLLGSLIAVPIWIKIADKINDNRRTIIISGFVSVIFSIPIIFIDSYLLFILAVIFWGIGIGGFSILIDPIFSDIIDEAELMTNRRKEGIYKGIQSFFNKLAIIIQVLTIALVHTFTGFVEGAATQSDAAIWGIRLHLALFPMIFMLISVLIFWKFYDLTINKLKIIKEKLNQVDV